MTSTSFLAIVGAILFILFTFGKIFAGDKQIKGIWLLPAFLSFLFFIFSIYTVVTEGPTGFWSEHTRSYWGNQIWFDLLLAIGIGWYFILPQARKLGMRPVPWLILIISTGSIGVLAMVARLLYLQEAHEKVESTLQGNYSKKASIA